MLARSYSKCPKCLPQPWEGARSSRLFHIWSVVPGVSIHGSGLFRRTSDGASTFLGCCQDCPSPTFGLYHIQTPIRSYFCRATTPGGDFLRAWGNLGRVCHSIGIGTEANSYRVLEELRPWVFSSVTRPLARHVLAGTGLARAWPYLDDDERE